MIIYMSYPNAPCKKAFSNDLISTQKCYFSSFYQVFWTSFRKCTKYTNPLLQRKDTRFSTSILPNTCGHGDPVGAACTCTVIGQEVWTSGGGQATWMLGVAVKIVEFQEGFVGGSR